jgi:N-acetylneuraminate synthase
MSSVDFRDSVKVSDYTKPYIVVEMNTSHFGEISLAKQMIDHAVDAGANCVKFQSWTEDSLYSEEYYAQNPIARKFVKKFSFDETQLFELAEYSLSRKISFASTPYSRQEVDFLVEECNVPFIKIASMDLNNLPFLKFIGAKGVPIILSTGMGEEREISDALVALTSTGNTSIVLLHCISLYPTPTEILNLNNILGLRESFPDFPIGFSDHSEGINAAIASTALGAALIEKHFTLDKTRIGMDNQMAIEFAELKELVKSCSETATSLGSRTRVLSEMEFSKRSSMRRSLVARIDLEPGDILSEDNLEAKRPGTGLPPSASASVLGRKLKHKLLKGAVLNSRDLM